MSDTNPPEPSPSIVVYLADPLAFKELQVEEQLMVIADIVLYWADMKVWALEKAGKTRVDSCIEAQKYYNREKYWEAINMNIKKVAEIKARGL